MAFSLGLCVGCDDNLKRYRVYCKMLAKYFKMKIFLKKNFDFDVFDPSLTVFATINNHVIFNHWYQYCFQRTKFELGGFFLGRDSQMRSPKKQRAIAGVTIISGKIQVAPHPVPRCYSICIRFSKNLRKQGHLLPQQNLLF